MPKGYMIGMITVSNVEAYKPYVEQTTPIVHEYGGRYIVRGGAIDMAEGNIDHERIVVIEFASLEKVKSFYNDPRYVEIRKIRQAHSDGFVMHIVGNDLD